MNLFESNSCQPQSRIAPLHIRKSTSRFFLSVALSLIVLPWRSSAYIYIPHSNDTMFPSLPGLFGSAMQDGVVYTARLQYLRDDSYLCRPPSSISGNHSSLYSNNYNSSNETLSFVKPNYGNASGEEEADDDEAKWPVALLVSRGHCPFQQKAEVAERLSTSIQFLIVSNYDLDGEDVLVPMSSEQEDLRPVRLALLSVSHRTGQELKRYIAEQDEAVLLAGGPLIQMDSTSPENLMTAQDLQQMILSALGLFFMLVSFSGCLMILVGTFGRVQNGRIVFVAPDGGGAGVFGPSLLTVEQVHQLSQFESNKKDKQQSLDIKSTHTQDTAACSCASAEQGMLSGMEHYENEGDDDEEEEDISCAVCIDGFSENCATTVLPCQHKFHTDCIVPWLTERQSKCPLCKFDVLQYIHDKEAESAAAINASSNLSSSSSTSSAASLTASSPARRRPVWLDRVLPSYAWTHISNQEASAAFDSRGGDIGGRRGTDVEQTMPSSSSLSLSNSPPQP